MAKSALELAVETGKWDAGLKKAKSALDSFTEANGGLQKALAGDSSKMQQFVRMMGQTESTAKTAKGQMNDYKSSIEALTMQYNRMTDAQKKTIGQDYLRAIDQMKQKYQGVAEEVQKINQSLKSMPEPAALSGGGGLFGGGQLGGMLQVFGGNLMTKAAGMGVGFASELGDMVKQSIELARQGEGIRIAFERLGRGDILDGLRQATHGTVSDIELMKAAVKFNDFRLPLEELGTMLAFAQQKAKDTGQSVDYMVDSIVTGLGRKSLMILDNLGLSAAEIKEKMKDTGDMTKAVGEIIREQMSKAGEYIETAADRATKANVEVQNAMERLGETFQPLTDAGTSMFNSLKVGALDFINKALRPMINMLTEAGRMRKLYNAQKGTNDAKIQDMLAGLSSSELPQHQHRVNLAYWDKNINKYQQYLADYKTWQKDKTSVGAYDRMTAFQKETGLSMFSDVKEQLEVFKRQKADYVKLSKDLLTKKVEDNKVEEQSIDSLKKKLQELQAERKKAIAAGDTDLSKNLLKQINQTKTDIKGLSGGTTTTTTHQTPQQRAQESFTKAEQNYKQALEQAAMELEAGTITRAEAKKKEMQAAEQRWKAIGDARNISDSDRLRQAQDEAAAEYKRLAAEAKTATERQKALDKATRDLENANQKLATARQEMAQAKQQGDLQAYNTAKDKATAAQKEITRLEKVKVDVETGTVNLPDIPTEMTTTVDFQADTRNIDAAISDVKKEMDTIPVGTIKFNLDQTKLVDLTTLKTLIDEQVKNGLDIDPEVTQGLFSKIQLGVDIEDTTWQDLIDKINENLKKLGLDTIKIDFTTGETSKKGRGREKKNPYLQYNEERTTTASLNGVMGGIANGMSQMVSGMESLGVEIPEGIKGAINAIQGVSTILTGIATTVLAIEALSTANLFKFFSHGGVVHAANGYVDGNTYSGDQIPAMLNAGELVLNKAQQGVLASSLQAVGQSGEGGGGGRPYVNGEMIWLGLTNYLNRSGRGEIVTSRRK